MKNIKLRFHLSGVIPFLLLSACTLPTQISSPVPVANPGQAETSIARTAQAAAKQTEQVDLATPTLTTIPTETLTPTPKVSLYGTSLIIGEDQSTLFIDHKAGVQLTIPAGWMAVRVNECKVS